LGGGDGGASPKSITLTILARRHHLPLEIARARGI
jgi:hypothetical protein